MHLGFSSYSFHQRLNSGQMTIFDVIDWIADSPGDHLELADVYRGGGESAVPTLGSPPEFVARVRDHAASRGVGLAGYCTGANLLVDTEAEVKRLSRYVDLVADLGITRMRHDVTGPTRYDGDDTEQFEQALPVIAAAAREVARYAAGKGVTTSLENHGFFVQASDRVRRVVRAVGEANFGTTLDVGNFVCVDEDPTVAVPLNLPFATTVHLKDFYIRAADQDPGEGWFASRGGKHLRGAIVGNGDLDLRAVVGSLVAAGYDDTVTIEFEGVEDCLIGCSRGIANAQRLLDAASGATA